VKHTPRRYSEHQAAERLLHHLQLLDLELRLGSPRRYLDVLVELCELLADLTGPVTLATQALRKQLAAAKAAVVNRSNLRLVQ
jgi:DNA-binding transcriptional MerR regulator